jgi:hypothetical protein
MSKSLHPWALTLRVWASKIERNLLTAEEAKTISKLLRDVAAGEDFDEAIGVKRSANRPHMDMTKYYVEQVYGLTQSVFNPIDQQEIIGMPVSKAIGAVAQACNVSPNTVKTAYYSKEGRQHFNEIKAIPKSPLS